MEARATTVLRFLSDAQQFVIPIYQRTYSWTEKQCQQLFDDILQVGAASERAEHFIGSVVYVRDGHGHKSPSQVIDGQQRLTTLSLLLAAIARHVQDEEPVKGFSSDKIRDYYLLNHRETGDERYKLLLTQTDTETLKSIIDRRETPKAPSQRLIENFDFFSEGNPRGTIQA